MAFELIHDKFPIPQLSPAVFDKYMEKGWRFLGEIMLRHNALMYKEEFTMTVPLRIRLDGFSFSKSQAKVLRTHRNYFQFRIAPIEVTAEKNQLFLRHCNRFEFGHHYTDLRTFITPNSRFLPVQGLEIEVYDQSKLVACSYFHVGQQSICATYCFFDPDYTEFSLGNFTMYLEIELAIRLKKQWYYTGYAHQRPSQFDYKYNFNNLESMDWVTEQWVPHPRQIPQKRS
jgi:arginine-tRNA-protein transferase